VELSKSVLRAWHPKEVLHRAPFAESSFNHDSMRQTPFLFSRRSMATPFCGHTTTTSKTGDYDAVRPEFLVTSSCFMGFSSTSRGLFQARYALACIQNKTQVPLRRKNTQERIFLALPFPLQIAKLPIRHHSTSVPFCVPRPPPMVLSYYSQYSTTEDAARLP
jgi:hypothetical protein